MSEQRRRRQKRTAERETGASSPSSERREPGTETERSTDGAIKKTESATASFANVRLSRTVLGKFRPPGPSSPAMADSKIAEYLDRNKDFLETYVIENIPIEQLKAWMTKKLEVPKESTNSSKSTPIAKDTIPRKQIFLELARKLQDYNNEQSVARELGRFVSISIGVDAYRIYKLFMDHPRFVQYFDDNNVLSEPKLVRADTELVQNVIKVAKRGTSWRISRGDDPSNFPDIPRSLLVLFGLQNVKHANHMLYQPILAANGKTAYVIEMYRMTKEFTEAEEETTANFVVWGSMILRYTNLYMNKKRERNMSDFLLDVVKSIFEEMESLEPLIKRILEFAQRLVNADRASLFLVDYRNFELVSTVFDLKFDPDYARDLEKKEIRVPINRGIAGHVALSGETMNVPDAYSDCRFNREVDEVTGYKTVTILCMPVKVQGKVIGVVQMVNKRDDTYFDHEDEEAFELFSSFFSLALHHARLYDKIIRKEQKYKVALEVLSYHNTCKEHEVKAILTYENDLSLNLNNFHLDPYKFDDMEKCKAAIFMFADLFDMGKFDIVTLTRFLLTVKKNYRTVPYHNFDHGWSVAHAMYVILKHDTRNRFDYKTRLSMFVASLCHDLDHRGYTNKYMSETASPLAAMYTTSTLEHHHFNITVTILQQDGHNIFSHFSSEDYKDILRGIRQCILATDLAVFFPKLEELIQIYEGKSQHPTFSWDIPSHRELALAIAMTAADLSASAKPWAVQIKTVKVIFEEFYDQGDKERDAGRNPIPMMDRNKPDQQPSSQVGFLSQICVPCYSMLYKILPNTKPMYMMALKNLNHWKSRASRIQRKLEKDVGWLAKTSSSGSFDETTEDTPDDDETGDTGLLGIQEIPADSDEGKKEENGELAVTENVEENNEVVEEIRKPEAAWKNLKTNSVSGDEDEDVTLKNLSGEGGKGQEDEEPDEDVAVATVRKQST